MRTALTGRTHGCTDQCCTRAKNPCQPGAVHTWHKADVQIALMNVRFRGQSGHLLIAAVMSADDPKRIFGTSDCLLPVLLDFYAPAGCVRSVPCRALADPTPMCLTISTA